MPRNNFDPRNKFMSLDQAENLAEFLRGLCHPPKIGLVNGCFDLFHEGHYAFLRVCKNRIKRGCLFVAVNTDTSIREIKGDGRPVVNFERRIRTIEDLYFVDFVIPIFDATAASVIRAIKPNIIFRGHDQISTCDETVAIIGVDAQVYPLEKYGDMSTTGKIAAR